ncbi:MAG: hypothetical protein ACFFDD_04820, partial [Promethearchaeota archaeon]
RGGGRVTSVNLVGDQVVSLTALIVSAIVGSLPLIGYSVILLLTGNHLLSILSQLSISLLELVLLLIGIPRVLRD